MPNLAALTLLAALASPASFGGHLTTVPAVGDGAPTPVYVARPGGPGPFPAVLLLHGCEGFNGFDAVAADRLALLGYVAVALDALGDDPPFAACSGHGRGETAEVAAARATLSWLRTQPYVVADRLALVGFSMGANATLDLVDPAPSQALPAGVRAAAAYYPHCDGRDAHVRVPVDVFAGDADRIAPSAPCAALGAAAKAAGAPLDVTVYAGATHGFLVPGSDRTFFGEPIRYDAIAARDSALKIAQLLEQNLR